MANVITSGTFDLFHIGHLRLLQRARSVVRKELLCHGV
ncbi:MAG: adenylyltransferase/cytidyltransferase family protein [Kiritimatiellae bacterium]|nr:adenylyltransferase/cytidyltransferase family protein [Kiritimatiellia bacterium]